jgi:hypothetical protein
MNWGIRRDIEGSGRFMPSHQNKNIVIISWKEEIV